MLKTKREQLSHEHARSMLTAVLGFMPAPPSRPVAACRCYHSARPCMMAPDLRMGEQVNKQAGEREQVGTVAQAPQRHRGGLFMMVADPSWWVVEEADKLHAAKKIDAVFELLAGADATDHELAWRIARAHHDKAEESTGDDAGREQLLREGLVIAEAAKERSSGASTACHGYALKWYAILLGQLGDFLPTKEKVANSYKIKEALEASAALLPEDSSVQTALGQWCYKVAGISFIERNAAKLLFGRPPASSYAEALSYLEASYALKSNKKAALFAALCHAKLKDKAAAREWLQRCLELDSVGEADRELDQQAQAALK